MTKEQTWKNEHDCTIKNIQHECCLSLKDYKSKVREAYNKLASVECCISGGVHFHENLAKAFKEFEKELGLTSEELKDD